jgi:hypothetical protein
VVGDAVRLPGLDGPAGEHGVAVFGRPALREDVAHAEPLGELRQRPHPALLLRAHVLQRDDVGAHLAKHLRRAPLGPPRRRLLLPRAPLGNHHRLPFPFVPGFAVHVLPAARLRLRRDLVVLEVDGHAAVLLLARRRRPALLLQDAFLRPPSPAAGFRQASPRVDINVTNFVGYRRHGGRHAEHGGVEGGQADGDGRRRSSRRRRLFWRCGAVVGGTPRSPDDDDTRPFGAPAPAGQQGAEAVEERRWSAAMHGPARAAWKNKLSCWRVLESRTRTGKREQKFPGLGCTCARIYWLMDFEEPVMSLVALTSSSSPAPCLGNIIVNRIDGSKSGSTT